MFTKHAHKRAQQRAIPPLIEDLLLLYGDHKYEPGNKEIYFFSKKSKKRMARDLGTPIVDCLSKFLNVAMVKASNDDVVTVFKRTKKIKNKIRGRKCQSHIAESI